MVLIFLNIYWQIKNTFSLLFRRMALVVSTTEELSESLIGPNDMLILIDQKDKNQSHLNMYNYNIKTLYITLCITFKYVLYRIM